MAFPALLLTIVVCVVLVILGGILLVPRLLALRDLHSQSEHRTADHSQE